MITAEVCRECLDGESECLRCYKEGPCGCFEGNGSVTMADGTHAPVRDLRQGAQVLTLDGAAEVMCVVRTRCEADSGQGLVEVAPGLLLTPGHPIRVDGHWQQAGTGSCRRGPVQTAANPGCCEYVYNFVLSRGHVLIVGGVECVTLGHGFREEGVRHA